MPTEAEMVAGANSLCCLERSGLLPVIKVWLLSQRLNPVPTAAEMLAGANTLCCLEQSGMLPIISVWLEGRIVDLGGSGDGGTNFISDGVIDPVAAPSDPAQNWIYVNSAETPKTVWFWEGGSGAWVQLV